MRKLNCSAAARVLRQGRVRAIPAGYSHRDLHRRRLGDRDERIAAGLRADDPGGPWTLSPGPPMNSRACSPADRRRRGGGCADDRVQLVPARHADPSQQRVAATCARDFQRPASCGVPSPRISDRGAAPGMRRGQRHASATLLSHAGVRKVATWPARRSTTFRAIRGHAGVFLVPKGPEHLSKDRRTCGGRIWRIFFSLRRW